MVSVNVILRLRQIADLEVGAPLKEYASAYLIIKSSAWAELVLLRISLLHGPTPLARPARSGLLADMSAFAEVSSPKKKSPGRV